jgi:hypothetical protein
MSALQASAEHARNPGQPVIDLGAECRGAGLGASAIMPVIRDAHVNVGGHLATPALAELIEGMIEDARTMIRAVTAGVPSEGDAAQARLGAIRDAASLSGGTEIEPASVARLAGLSEEAGDSLRRLAMDLHKALNHLASGCAEEIVAGAHDYGLAGHDRLAVEAFMRVVEETRCLKFDHPGLGTTATRSRPRLIIQNDIGTTDAHVIVLAIIDNAVTLTHTDVHLPRAKFWSGSEHWGGSQPG